MKGLVWSYDYKSLRKKPQNCIKCGMAIKSSCKGALGSYLSLVVTAYQLKCCDTLCTGHVLCSVNKVRFV